MEGDRSTRSFLKWIGNTASYRALEAAWIKSTQPLCSLSPVLKGNCGQEEHLWGMVSCQCSQNAYAPGELIARSILEVKGFWMKKQGQCL